jgi:hypothetical protein
MYALLYIFDDRLSSATGRDNDADAQVERFDGDQDAAVSSIVTRFRDKWKF